MKQVERRFKEGVHIYCTPTLKEKLKILFSRKFKIEVDFSVNAEPETKLASIVNLKTF